MANKDECQEGFSIDDFEILPWHNNFNTGHEHIDEQHRTLVKLLNKLARTLINQDYSSVNNAFDELANYANLHFMDEETVWLKYFDEDDPWLRTHQHNHNTFMPKVRELQFTNVNKTLPELVEKIMQFLIRWLAFHIIEDDKRMASAIRIMQSGVSLDNAKIIADSEMKDSLHVLIDTILNMYDSLSSRTLVLLRERCARIEAEEQLREANLKLAELSNTDQLTDLYNRRYLDIVFDSESRRALRDNSMLTFYMIDVDYFKHYNDSYGHPAGDQVLKDVAERLKKTCRRPHDYVFRMGGEEFGILTTFHAEQEAANFGEIIRNAIEEMKIPHEYSDVNIYVTVSLGGCCCIPSKACDFSEYMKVADKRLYMAKTTGRNRVVMSD